LAINLWHRKFVIADVTAVFVNNQHDMKRQGQDFDQKNRIWRDTQQRAWQTNFSRKAGQSMMLLSCSKSCETHTQTQLTGGQAVVDRAVPTLKKTLSFFFRSSRSLPLTVLSIVRWSDRKHRFVRKENKVIDRLRELLKQKLSALHASSAVRVRQLLCTAPLETFKVQVLSPYK